MAGSFRTSEGSTSRRRRRTDLHQRSATSIELLDSRRLTGPNLVADVPGAVIDTRIDPHLIHDFLRSWKASVRRVLEAVGWADETTATRTWKGGVTVFHSAPVDALYAATEVNEWAWTAAAHELGENIETEPLAQAAERLRQTIDDERNPALLELRAAAETHDVTFLSDDDHASVGLGSGCSCWPVDELPRPEDVPWPEVHDVPRVMVTGTNGKTTTVRMLASILDVVGVGVGFTCTDGIYVSGEVIDAGDWSGPGGARTLLRDQRVTAAVLETARGGMLRRGLALDRVDAACVTNVAADHLGEWGIDDVEGVAEAKLLLAKAVRHGAPLIVSADDPVLSVAAGRLGRSITWLASDYVAETEAAMHPADLAWVAADGWLSRSTGGERTRIVEIDRVPATLGGAAVFNVMNALGAAALAHALGVADESIAEGLIGFDPDPAHSPGRTNLFDLGGVRVLVDFVHNPHGFAAVGRMARALGPERIGLMIGHAGDRDDEAILELARTAWRCGPDRVAVKELPEYLRGRERGEVPALIAREIVRLGAPEGAVSVHPDEIPAARALLEWSRSGDLVILSTQSNRESILDLVRGLESVGWSGGAPLPV